VNMRVDVAIHLSRRKAACDEVPEEPSVSLPS